MSTAAVALAAVTPAGLYLVAVTALVVAGRRELARAAADVLAEHWHGPEASLRVLRRLAGA